MAGSHRQLASVAVLAAGLGLGMMATPAAAAITSKATASAPEGSSVLANTGRRAATGTAVLRVTADALASQWPLPFTLTSAKVSGVLQRRGRVAQPVTIHMRPRGVSGDNWKGRTTLRDLAPGRYRVTLKHLRTKTTVPGGRIPARRLSGQTASVRVRPQRTTSSRGKYSVAAVSHLRVSGSVVDGSGDSVRGVPVCSEDTTRFLFVERCDATNRKGRFVVSLQPRSEQDLIGAAWEPLRVGDPRLDLAWQTRSWAVSDLPERLVVEQRGAVTGVVSSDSGPGLAGRSICAVPRDMGGAYMPGGWLMDQRWCTATDADGRYSLRVDEDGETRIWVPGDPASKGFVDVMDPILAADDGSAVFRWDVGRNPNTPLGSVPRWPWGDFRDMTAMPGRQWDLTLTDLVPGEAIQVTGRLTHTLLPDTVLADDLVCGLSRAGYQCTRTDSTGHYRLSLPSKVDPDSPGDPVSGKIVVEPRGGQWGDKPAWSRFDAVPGASVTADLVLAP